MSIFAFKKVNTGDFSGTVCCEGRLNKKCVSKTKISKHFRDVGNQLYVIKMGKWRTMKEPCCQLFVQRPVFGHTLHMQAYTNVLK